MDDNENEDVGVRDYGMALTVAGVLEIGAVVVAVVGGLSLLGEAAVMGQSKDLSGAQIAIFLAVTAIVTVLISGLLAAAGYIIDAVVGCYEQLWHLRNDSGAGAGVVVTAPGGRRA